MRTKNFLFIGDDLKETIKNYPPGNMACFAFVAKEVKRKLYSYFGYFEYSSVRISSRRPSILALMIKALSCTILFSFEMALTNFSKS